MAHSTCGSLFEASKALLQCSGLIHWSGAVYVATHPAEDDSEFEKYSRTKFDPAYGRYMCWLLFSVGAENLAKAACVCNEIVKINVSTLKFPRYKDPMSPMDWVNNVLNDTKDENDTQAETHNYGTLERYWDAKKYKRYHFGKLCEKHPVSSEDRDLLIASYKYLTKTIRNREFLGGKFKRNAKDDILNSS